MNVLLMHDTVLYIYAFNAVTTIDIISNVHRNERNLVTE